MIWDIVKFGKLFEAAATLDELTIGELITKLRLGETFRREYLGRSGPRRLRTLTSSLRNLWSVLPQSRAAGGVWPASMVDR